MTYPELKTRHDDIATTPTLATRYGAEMPRPRARQMGRRGAPLRPSGRPLANQHPRTPRGYATHTLHHTFTSPSSKTNNQ